MATSTLYFDSSISGGVATPANALGAIDGTFTTNGNTNSSWTHRWRFGVLGVRADATGTQSISIRMRKGSNTNNPSVSSVTLYQNDISLGALTLSTGSTTITSTVGQDLVYTFAGSLLDELTVVDLEISASGVGGSGSARNSVEIDAATWTVEYTEILGTAFSTWNGSIWITGLLKIWDGALWQPAVVQRWDGSTWVNE